ncbi:hypothetical protein MAR_023247 [Mya arenaria]|uniref:Mitochondria-eating protein C-terminal domain-containing protein n=1 Tax=Mya arenaria TaxID=6604 RepID=A0ABY7DND6_MYAAR|nr:hypothetical protein MAR_023247 [Mya arenaria]
MGQQGINDFQLVGVTAPEGVREPSPGSVPFSELLNRVEKEANRLLSCIISLRKAKPYGPSTVKLFREECIYSKRELHLIRYVPANRPSPEQQHEQKENNVKKKDNPVQTNIIVELRTRLANALEHNGYLEESNKRLLAENEDLSIRTYTSFEIQPIHVTDRMKKLLKEMSESMAPVVQMAYLEASWDNGCVEDLKPFIIKCIYVCWMMVVQNPQMCFFVPKSGTDVNTSMFKMYTRSGKAVDFIVWPAMMLHETGSVICKGVLQPK